jgi:hypothetical protein
MSMIESTEDPDDVERLLGEARKHLHAFEQGVNTSRLLERLRSASPAHPILLLRALTAFSVFVLLAGALGVIVATMFNARFARFAAPFDAAVPLPAFVPDNLGLPALLAVLAGLMAVAWVMATQAALGLGRDAAMLPWEQKQHQKLVNEVTRLTTQKAVMERIKNTPAGGRPRIATPVPVSMRDRSRVGGLSSPSLPNIGGSRPLGGMSIPPPDMPSRPAADLAGGLRAGSLGADPSASLRGRPSLSPQHLPSPPSMPPASSLPPPNRPAPGQSPRTGTSFPPHAPSFPPLSSAPGRSPGGAAAGKAGGGLLARARATGGNAAGSGSGATPRPPPSSGNPAPSHPSLPPISASSPPSRSPFAGLGRGVSMPPGEALKPRFNVPEAFPGAGARGVPSSPPPVGGGSVSLDEVTPDLPTEGGGIVDSPNFAPISEGWLRDALALAGQLGRGFPPQIRLEYSQEDGVPFTVVASRATQAMTVRAMLQFVEFLSAIPTPAQARIEIINVPSLDRSFHSNVEAALEPHFGDKFMIESHPGRVDIFFNEPDPCWEPWQRLPLAE